MSKTLTQNEFFSQLSVIIDLDHSLAAHINANNRLNKAISQEISQRFAELLGTLGIPGTPVIRFGTPGADKKYDRKFLSISLHGHPCRYSEELLNNVYSYIIGVPPDPNRTPAHIMARLIEFAGDGGHEGAHHHGILVEFFGLLCIEIVKMQPALLLNAQQVEVYKKFLKPLEKKFELDWDSWPDNYVLQSILAGVLNLRISIAQREVAAAVLQSGFSEERSPKKIVENLVIALQLDVVEIQLPQDYLRDLTIVGSGGDEGYFSLMRDGLFYELGVHYPEFRFVPVTNLRPGAFCFKINHLTTMPQIGLGSADCLVNDTSDRLALSNIKGTSAINPANGTECSIISLDDQEIAESDGLTTWDQMGFLVLSFSSELRVNCGCFINCDATRDLQETLSQAFPALVASVVKKFSVEQITKVLRNLLAEEISVRNLRQILELLLDFDYIVTDDYQYIIYDERLPVNQLPDELWFEDSRNLAEFVRTGMKRYISHKYTRGANTLLVYLLDPEIDKILSDHHNQLKPISNDNLERILEAVKAEVSTRPATTSIPTILTTVSIRGYMREIIRHEMPRLPVLAYQELSADMNIQPVARIAFDIET